MSDEMMGTAHLYVPKAQYDALAARLEEALGALRYGAELFDGVDEYCPTSCDAEFLRKARAVLKERS
jgi:hypothetical protein